VNWIKSLTVETGVTEGSVRLRVFGINPEPTKVVTMGIYLSEPPTQVQEVARRRSEEISDCIGQDGKDIVSSWNIFVLILCDSEFEDERAKRRDRTIGEAN
jgi:hypothetical protein